MNAVVTDLTWAPLLPVWVIALTGLVAMIPVFFGAWRGARGTVLRGLAAAALILTLVNPRLIRETREERPDVALLLLDRSGSMTVGDREAIADAMAKRLAALAAKLPGLDLRIAEVPPGNGTDLLAAARAALADVPPERLSAVIALTDGMAHDLSADPKEGAAAFGAPLHVMIPAAGEETDRRLRLIEVPAYGLVGQSVSVRLVVDDLGPTPPAGAIRITVRRDQDPPIEQVIVAGEEHLVEIPVTKPGPLLVSIAAEALPGEASTRNNAASFTIRGVRDRLRVMLVSGEPHPGERTWRRLLKSDPSVDLVHFTILRPPDKDDSTPLNELALIAFPVRELFQVKIRDFDLIILDRFQNRNLLPTLYLRNIADYVRDGGALLMSVGPEFLGPSSLANTPIGAVLPARPEPGLPEVDERFVPVVTDLGERHPVTRGLHNGAEEWGPWYRRIRPGPVNGDVVMQTPDGAPLLILGETPRPADGSAEHGGRVALLLSDQIWLWSRDHGGGGPQSELLRRVAHWAMQEPELEPESLQASVVANALRVTRQTVSKAAPAAVTLTGPSGDTRSLTLAQAGPGRWQAVVDAPAPGAWHLTDGTLSAGVSVPVADPREEADLRATATVLTQTAALGGGGVRFQGGTAARDVTLRRTETGRVQSGADWIGLPRRHDFRVTGIAEQPLLPLPLAVPLLLGFLIAAWRREST